MTVEKKLIITDHPLIQHKLTLMRNHETPTNLFRSLLKEISILMINQQVQLLLNNHLEVLEQVALTIKQEAH